MAKSRRRVAVKAPVEVPVVVTGAPEGVTVTAHSIDHPDGERIHAVVNPGDGRPETVVDLGSDPEKFAHTSFVVLDEVVENSAAITPFNLTPEYYNAVLPRLADRLADQLNAVVINYDIVSVTLRSNINSVEACANIEQPFDDIVRAFRSMGL